MKGIKFQIEKLVNSIDSILYNSKVEKNRQIFDINYYKFSSEALHLSHLLFQECYEIDQPIKKIYQKMIKKLKEASKIRPQEQSEQDDQYPITQVNDYLNHHPQIPHEKERRNLEYLLNQFQDKEKDTAHFLKSFDHMKNNKSQNKIKPVLSEKSIQTNIIWINNIDTIDKTSDTSIQDLKTSFQVKKPTLKTNKEIQFHIQSSSAKQHGSKENVEDLQQQSQKQKEISKKEKAQNKKKNPKKESKCGQPQLKIKKQEELGKKNKIQKERKSIKGKKMMEQTEKNTKNNTSRHNEAFHSQKNKFASGKVQDYIEENIKNKENKTPQMSFPNPGKSDESSTKIRQKQNQSSYDSSLSRYPLKSNLRQNEYSYHERSSRLEDKSKLYHESSLNSDFSNTRSNLKKETHFKAAKIKNNENLPTIYRNDVKNLNSTLNFSQEDYFDTKNEEQFMKMFVQENLTDQEVEEKDKVIINELQKLKNMETKQSPKKITFFIRLMERMHDNTCGKECKHLKKFYRYLKGSNLYSYKRAIILPITRITFNR